MSGVLACLTRFLGLWCCCQGTGIEAFARLQDSIYWQPNPAFTPAVSPAVRPAAALTLDAEGTLLLLALAPLALCRLHKLQPSKQRRVAISRA